jgi:hypothetical protein
LGLFERHDFPLRVGGCRFERHSLALVPL